LAEEFQLQLNGENNVDNSNNDDENHNNENDNNNNEDDEDDEDYTPSSDAENEKMYCDTNEINTFENEALISTERLQYLLGHIGITTALEFKIKRIPCPG
jgi:hypothetical protein